MTEHDIGDFVEFQLAHDHFTDLLGNDLTLAGSQQLFLQYAPSAASTVSTVTGLLRSDNQRLAAIKIEPATRSS